LPPHPVRDGGAEGELGAPPSNEAVIFVAGIDTTDIVVDQNGVYALTRALTPGSEVVRLAKADGAQARSTPCAAES
jgi:hypothetical protein